MTLSVRITCAGLGIAFLSLVFALTDVPFDTVALLVLAGFAVLCFAFGPVVLRVVLDVDLD